jgi:hypothetical protein
MSEHLDPDYIKYLKYKKKYLDLKGGLFTNRLGSIKGMSITNTLLPPSLTDMGKSTDKLNIESGAEKNFTTADILASDTFQKIKISHKEASKKLTILQSKLEEYNNIATLFNAKLATLNKQIKDVKDKETICTAAWKTSPRDQKRQCFLPAGAYYLKPLDIYGVLPG